MDVNQGDSQRPNCGRALTLAETRHRTTLTETYNVQIFSATPPFEALILLVSFSMSPQSLEERAHVPMFVEITRDVKFGYNSPLKILEVVRTVCVAFLKEPCQACETLERTSNASHVMWSTRLASFVVRGPHVYSRIERKTCKRKCVETLSSSKA